MKPNGKTFVVRAVLFVVCAVGLFSSLAGAQTVHGTFKLPVEAHWGMMVLAPGEYEFVVDTGSFTRMITVRSKDSGWSGMVLSESASDASSATGASLMLAKSEDGMYVRTLYLNDAGVALNFGAPKTRMTKLGKSATPTMASASGTH
jgi:hypothetical protein